MNREAGSACPDRHYLIVTLAVVRNEPISKAPVPVIVNETVPCGVAGMIKNDRLLLVRVRPDCSTSTNSPPDSSVIRTSVTISLYIGWFFGPTATAIVRAS